MNTVHEIDEVRSQVKTWRKQGFTIGLVTTMGFLHEGHESLIKRAVSENDRVVVSVFVNPTQFGPNEDFKTYPRDIKRDAELCEGAGANLIFNPEPSTMYYEDSSTVVNVNGLTEGLCGARRPVHFGGVCLVVSKFFNIVTPDKAYFGEKDAQQLAVIKRMVRDLNFDIEIVGCPIVREADGLARSSRNTYLSEDERKAAVILNRSLDKAKKFLNAGERNADNIKKVIVEKLNSEPLARVDYVEVVDSLNLKPVLNIDRTVLIAIAVYIGKVRLIDNFTFKIQKN
ncbi:MAG: pantoate--beta-alanine ligase [Clostridium sp.]|uniref:pantoate--beta-alanine ligase n=1 Tax=Clostridium sp. TaxID=1506 RepID=UPI0025C68537|nr:pantoate--beta-alanine ligase [Clostridium sp.]MCH3963757.1 pantoate--beta-alanine ligase [Clostridium sp.]MCI1714898.1 pantoate--beta-alanine ligase [Clostridium sp.]MCI1798913.1 pantoate--beta-alanine ligase [Clostridium sp.]MCI1813081.1 pantoate--beta-alanine ligase [Clostridium sp.]MCI1869971.1 pantoate--beta-alanine ligase [Clostridium sp.]